MRSGVEDKLLPVTNLEKLSSFKDLTKNFEKGAYSRVHKVIFRNHEIALKKMSLNDTPTLRVYNNEKHILDLLSRYLTNRYNLHIIRCYGYSEENLSSAFVAMGSFAFESASITVSVYIEKNNFADLPRLYQIATETAIGLNYLHSFCSIVHGDIKSSNLMLDANFRVKIIDFGFAQDLNNKINLVGGTPNYIAPEKWINQSCTTKTDVYSFGILLFELFIQAPLYPEIKTEENLKKEVCNGKRPNHFLFFTHPMRELMDECWDQDPEKRPNMHEVEVKLKAW